MNANSLLAVYDQLADAPDAIARLRCFVLDLAVRGKLVAQDPNDEPASELLKRVAAEKERLVKTGKIRKQKFLPPVEERPFHIPQTWMWVRIREVTSDRGQKFPEAQFTYIDVSAIDKENGQVVAPKVLQPSEAPSRARKVVQQGDVIYSCVRPYLLNVAIITNHFDPAAIASTAFAILNGHGLVLPRYLWITLRSPFMVSYVEDRQRGQAYPAINDADFALLPFPLPPLSEQHRIVSKVDELMALCDQLQKSRAARKEMRTRLTKATLARLNAPAPDASIFRSHARFAINVLPALTSRADQVKNLRQTILNLAVRGKLVEQNPNDEPAGDLVTRIAVARLRAVQSHKVMQKLALRNVAPSDVPYDLPKTWRWTYFGSIAEFSAGRTPPRKNTGYWNTGEFPWISIADIVDGETVQRTKETVSDQARTEVFKGQPVSPGTMIMSFKLTIGKIARLGIPAFHNEAIIAIRPYLDEIDPYLFKVLPDFARRGNTKGAIKGATLNRQSISNILIPLPPVAEQRRIVAKIEELMALCDWLEANLNSVDSTRSHLLESVLHEALSEVRVNH